MQSICNSKKDGLREVSIDLPEQKMWKELEGEQIKLALENDKSPELKEAKKFGRLLDKAFHILLEKVIRQS